MPQPQHDVEKTCDEVGINGPASQQALIDAGTDDCVEYCLVPLVRSYLSSAGRTMQDSPDGGFSSLEVFVETTSSFRIHATEREHAGKDRRSAGIFMPLTEPNEKSREFAPYVALRSARDWKLVLSQASQITASLEDHRR